MQKKGYNNFFNHLIFIQMQIKLVFLTICASLFAIGSAAPAPAPHPAPAPFIGPLLRIGSKIAPKITRQGRLLGGKIVPNITKQGKLPEVIKAQ